MFAVNVNRIASARIAVPASIYHALIHASDSVVQMQSARLNDTSPYANVHKAMKAMLHHHAFDNHERITHFHDTIRRSEEELPTTYQQNHAQTNAPNETYTLIIDWKTKKSKQPENKNRKTNEKMSLYVFKKPSE